MRDMITGTDDNGCNIWTAIPYEDQWIGTSNTNLLLWFPNMKEAIRFFLPSTDAIMYKNKKIFVSIIEGEILAERIERALGNG